MFACRWHTSVYAHLHVEVNAVPRRVVLEPLAVVKVAIGEVVPAGAVLLASPPKPRVDGVEGRHVEAESLVESVEPVPRVFGLVRVNANAFPVALVQLEVALVLLPGGKDLHADALGAPCLRIAQEEVSVGLLKLAQPLVLPVQEVPLVNVPVRRRQLPHPLHLAVLELTRVSLAQRMLEHAPPLPLPAHPLSLVTFSAVRRRPYPVPVPVIIRDIPAVNVPIVPLHNPVPLENFVLDVPRRQHPRQCLHLPLPVPLRIQPHDNLPRTRAHIAVILRAVQPIIALPLHDPIEANLHHEDTPLPLPLDRKQLRVIPHPRMRLRARRLLAVPSLELGTAPEVLRRSIPPINFRFHDRNVVLQRRGGQYVGAVTERTVLNATHLRHHRSRPVRVVRFDRRQLPQPARFPRSPPLRLLCPRRFLLLKCRHRRVRAQLHTVLQPVIIRVRRN